MHIGFIGLGNIGRPLALNLLKAGHSLKVYDLAPDCLTPLLEAGAERGHSAADCARGASHLITSLPSPAACRAVMEGADGALAALAAGAIWIEMSTTDMDDVMRLSAAAAEKSVAVIEAPVTGGCHRAASGEITILVSGERSVCDACMPLLQVMGGEIHYMGKLGNASVLKVVSNMLAFLHLVGIGEALMLCRKAGLDLDAVFHGLKASSGNSFVHETESQVIMNGSYNIGFTMDLACKDLNLALALARKYGLSLELCERIAGIFEEGRQKLGDRAWSSAIVKLLEDNAGQDLRCPGFPATLD